MSVHIAYWFACLFHRNSDRKHFHCPGPSLHQASFSYFIYISYLVCTTLWSKYYYYLQFLRGENWSPEWLVKFPKVTQQEESQNLNMAFWHSDHHPSSSYIHYGWQLCGVSCCTWKMTDYCVMREIFRNFGLFYLNHFWLSCYLEKLHEEVAVTSEMTKNQSCCWFCQHIILVGGILTPQMHH